MKNVETYALKFYSVIFHAAAIHVGEKNQQNEMNKMHIISPN